MGLDNFRRLLYRREADFSDQLAKLRVLMHRLKRAAGGEIGEQEVVPLVGDLKIF